MGVGVYVGTTPHVVLTREASYYNGDYDFPSRHSPDSNLEHGNHNGSISSLIFLSSKFFLVLMPPRGGPSFRGPPRVPSMVEVQPWEFPTSEGIAQVRPPDGPSTPGDQYIPPQTLIVKEVVPILTNALQHLLHLLNNQERNFAQHEACVTKVEMEMATVRANIASNLVCNCVEAPPLPTLASTSTSPKSASQRVEF